jgi:hypothetical protein
MAARRVFYGSAGVALVALAAWGAVGCVALRDPNARAPFDDAALDATDAVTDARVDAGPGAAADAGADARTDAPACAAGRILCDGRCVDPADPEHCGACDTRCTADTRCAADDAGVRRCAPSACAAGFGDCDGNAANGCEASLATSAAHCGACGRPCAPANATGGCSGGRCLVTACAEGFGDCDGDASNGCEIDLQRDPVHCGACGTRCAAANATLACTAGACTLTACADGFADCNGSLADGCEVDTRVNAAHCGACRRACTLSNAATACMEGVCRLAACNTNYGDCDGDPSNGCEVLLTSNVAHCGACRRACAAGQGCTSSNCLCSSGRTLCEGAGCVLLTTSVDHCGACGAACPTVANGSRACVSGRCAPQCSGGYVFQAGECVACGAAGQPACTSGATCAAGLTNCGGVCRDTRSDEAHCGLCGMACVAGRSCSEGVCCAAGQRNCGGICRDLLGDDAHCGGCGTSCTSQQRCVMGACAACGAMGAPCCGQSPACAMGLTCTSGVCR